MQKRERLNKSRSFLFSSGTRYEVAYMRAKTVQADVWRVGKTVDARGSPRLINGFGGTLREAVKDLRTELGIRVRARLLDSSITTIDVSNGVTVNIGLSLGADKLAERIKDYISLGYSPNEIKDALLARK